MAATSRSGLSVPRELMMTSRLCKFIWAHLATRNARASALSIAVTIATLHGRVFDEAASRHAVGHLPMTFCEAVRVPHSQSYTCGRRHWRVTTDGAGRFSIPGVKPGWFIYAGKSSEVAWYESLTYLDPSRGVMVMMVCSHKTQPHDCPDPKKFGAKIEL